MLVDGFRNALLVLVVVSSLVVPAALVGGVEVATGDANEPIEVQRHYENADGSDGRVTVTVTYRVPENHGEVPTESLGPDATVTDREGFTLRDARRGRVAEWNESAATSSITFTRPLFNRVPGAEGDGWAVFVPYRTESYYSSPHRGFDVNLTVTGEPAAASDGDTLFVGEHTTYRRDVGDHDVRLVVADAAEPNSDPQAVLDRMERMGRDLRAPPSVRDGTVTAYVRPGFNGLGLIGNAFHVGGEADVTRPGNGYLAEYGDVLVPQFTDETMAWTSGEYYSLYYPYLGGASYDRLVRATEATDEQRGIVLANRSAWAGSVDPGPKAMRVFAALDIRIQRATEGQRTLAHVLARAQDHPGGLENVSAADFQTLSERVADREFDAFFGDYVFGSEFPSLPERSPRYYASTENERPVATPTPTPTPTATPTPSPTPTQTPTPTPTPAPTEAAGTPSGVATTTTSVTAATEAGASGGSAAGPTAKTTVADAPAATTSGSGGGFGPLVALGTLLALAAGAAYRRWE